MFFIKTEERVVTRQELLSEGPPKGFGDMHTEYLTSIVCDDENGEPEFVSGVSTIQEKWNPFSLHIDSETADVAGSIMAEVNNLVDDPKDLAVIRGIVEKTIALCETETCKAEVAFGEDMRPAGEDPFAKQNMVYQVREGLRKLYYQEYCRLVWNGSICAKVTVAPDLVSDEHGIIVLCSETWTSVHLTVTLGLKIKKDAENEFFRGYGNWPGVNAVFQLKMLRFPETMAIAKLREYFGAMTELLQAKTVFESDMHENPVRPFGEKVYYPAQIHARLGTELVEEVQNFGRALKRNRCFEALCAYEKVQQLQEEACRITDRKVQEMTIEALSVLNQNWDALKKYFDIWNTYIGNIICSDQGVDAYIDNISLADYKEDNGGIINSI